MLRYLTLVALSALIGSTIGTLLWVAWLGGTGAPNPARFIVSFMTFTLIFTFPGAMMLAGLRAVLTDRCVGARSSVFVVLLAAGFSGAAFAAVISLQIAVLGGVYALATAVVLTCLQRVLDHSPKRSA